VSDPKITVPTRSGRPPETCRSCDTPIVFARMVTSGKWAPFERDDAAGEWIIVDGHASHQGKAPRLDDDGNAPVPRFTSHFAACPHAGKWRRKK
jgi:hypothetical protein